MSEGKRVLLVEDEPALLMLIGDALEDLGFDVTRLAEGQEAMQVLEAREPFDAVVSDISMPGAVSGLDIAARAIDTHPGTRMILVSGLSRSQLPQLPAAAQFLPKPYRLGQLMELLN